MRMMTMPEKERAEIAETETPEPRRGEVLLRVLECGICGSDLHAWHGKWGEDYRPGHEFCAVVEEAGPGVADLETGMRVTGECFGHCGECGPCESGAYNHCENIEWHPGRPGGAMAEEVCYRAEALFPLPEELTDRQGALVEPLAVAHHAMARARMEEGLTVAVIGAGTIGVLCVAVARARGAERIFSVAKYDHQAEMARRMGATDVIRVGEADPRKVIPDAVEGRGVDVAVDSVAAGTSFTTALALGAPRARVVEVGGVTRPLLAALQPLVGRELLVTGSNCYARTDEKTDFQWAMELIREGAVEPEKLVTHTFPLEEVEEAFRTADDKETGAVKVVVRMGEENEE